MRTLLMALGLLLAPVMTARAVSSDEDTPPRGRQLGGHTFQLPILQQSALITTHVGVREGVARYSVPAMPTGVDRRDLWLLGVQSTLDLGLRLTDWLDLSVFARATSVLGANVVSLVTDGGSLDSVGQAGVGVRLLRGEASGTQLTLRAVGGLTKERQLTLLPFIQAITNNPLLTLDDALNGQAREYLLVPGTEKSVTGGLFLAQALGPAFSLQASAVADYAWRTSKPFDAVVGGRVEQKTEVARVNLAAALTADMGPPLGIPIAVMGEYLFTTGWRTEVDLPDHTLNSHSLALGVYYSGRPHLQVGLGAAATLDAEPRRTLTADGQTLESDDTTLTYAQLILRYIF
ncbi:hypothetical protein OV208_37790 [Corallococcus sp. bb12-1]|uniref:hypothetical protein n=1 Tax=Corallococcus sp. bb12-1 TaxID=2996784 RepID=UPI00226E487B|nr:hypothetical protein [Corallococcus sp. bb12-1]MCY1047116.1 hypothetical protein [Corallococcus sp. bb12-1]